MSEPPSGIARIFSGVPEFRGIVWRGAAFQLWGPLQLTAPLPTSKDPRVASENFRSPYLHAIVACRGRDISALSGHPTEEEVVLLAGAVLTPVTAACRVEGHAVQVLREVGDHDDIIAPSHADLAPVLARARTAVPVPVTSPHRFYSGSALR